MSADVQLALRSWCELWGLADLAPRITVEISGRMTRSLGRCYPDRRLIRIARFVTEESEALFLEVLCHEAAHIAAHEIHGRAIRPHGPEWRELMTAAGYTPSTRFPESCLSRPLPKRRRRRTRRTLLDRLRAEIRRQARALGAPIGEP